MTPRAGFARVVIIAATTLFACGDPPLPEEHYRVAPDAKPPVAEAACLDRNPLRNAYWGDLHVHTSASSDAWMFDVRLGPEDAYRYAFGESVHLFPNDEQGRPTREVRIDRPLDFAAVTDHAEFLAEGKLCLDPEAPGYDGDFCETFRTSDGRSPELVMQIMSPITWRNDEVCGADNLRCAAASKEMWQRNIDAAEKWNDRTAACERTAFVAYEYSSFRMGQNLHRNVIFKNEVVPRQPVSYLDAHRAWELWDRLDRGCRKSGKGCDVLAIPHNSNISNGRMFAVDYPGTSSVEEQAARAALRIEIEPIIEIFQHKGDSECRNGLPGSFDAVDELCEFERFEDDALARISGDDEFDACYDGRFVDLLPRLGPSCVSPLSYVRNALTEGLAEAERIGVNPFKFGISASTDTHNALAGGVEERSFPGHLGEGDATPTQRTSYDGAIPGNANNNPGGLIGVWAEENDRASLFEAMRRKEVFGTSGPRIVPRFFGGYALPEDLCGASDPVARADAIAVPMGGDLPQRASNSGAPMFFASALADAGTQAYPGNPLQRLQVIKGWVDEAGVRRQRVYEIAGDANNGASVDTRTCETRGPGFDQLCAVFTDPDFDASRRAVYYMRAVENPSCRYNAWQCIGLEGDARPADCDDPGRKLAIQERAWTSPIWYTPES